MNIKNILRRTVFSVLVILSVICLVGCHSAKRVSKHNKKPRTEAKVFHSNLHGARKDIVKESMSWLGIPYRYGGNSKTEGVDCSGMVLQVYLTSTGIKLPRNSAKQAEYCKSINERDVRPGDLVFFATGKNPEAVSHVGIMVDESRFIHSSTSKGVVISDMTSPYYMRTFIMYGRVPGL